MTDTLDAAARQLDSFRHEVKAWLEANAKRRRHDTSEFKARVAATSQSRESEFEHVEKCKAWQRKIYDAGFAGIAVPVEYGGRGGSATEQRVFQQEAARYEIDTGVFSVGLAMVVPTLLACGTEEQKRKHLPAMLRGDHIWCQLFSEPGAGSDLAGLTTRAERDGDSWVVNGQKVWNSFAHVSDWGIMLARTDWDVPKHRGITYFLVDMRSPGIEVRPLRQITGVAHFNETFLTDVHIPTENVLGEVNGGWGVTQTTLMAERVLIGGGMGLGFRDFLELARHYGRTDDADVRQGLAASYTRSELLRWLGERARAAMKAGRPMGPESSVAKLAISQHVFENGNLALAIEGADAMLYEDDAFEHGFWQQQFLGQWGIRIGGGTEQVQRNILGERMLGLPPEARPDKTEPFREIPKNA
ncbi:MAG: acyl-CoA dehydrogenase family protein [Acidimicrobiia bacterium]|nr:acyl-CoA dehydrogenase family protein [Acidimicrobiia bacterium]